MCQSLLTAAQLHPPLPPRSDYYKHHQTWSRDGVRLREQGYMTTLLAAEAERLVYDHAARHSNASLFLWLSVNAPHVPLQAPAEWLEKQPQSLDPSVRTYAAMVGAMDDAFGRATSALREAGMLRTTLIVFASDNGGPIIPAACNGGLRGGKGSPYDGGVRAPAFLYWPACLGSARRTSRAPAHMVDLFATLVTAAAAEQPAQAQLAVRSRLRRKAPHSVPLWAALADGRASTETPELSRRQLVLQMSASSASVLRGRWKLVLAASRCFDVPAALSHDASVPGFKADRWLLHRLVADEANATLSARQTRARLRAVRRAGVEMQLYDLHADPAERSDLLAGQRLGNNDEAEPQTNETRSKVVLVGNLLGQYLSALRVGRRNLERAHTEGRVERGGARGWEMVVWFCRQVEFSWTAGRWRQYSRMMCRDRTEAERQQLAAVATNGHAGAVGGGMGGSGSHARHRRLHAQQQQQQQPAQQQHRQVSRERRRAEAATGRGARPAGRAEGA